MVILIFFGENEKNSNRDLAVGLYISFNCRALFSIVEFFSIVELEFFSIDLEILFYII